eukprot:TRINITY_DN7196_c0_g2_i1.p1 TRINITY_DN7196_c0_g2~~TRINITY_DN7196_c0_g2_i1.p1  ORF type:complete len:143 (+),score=7.18 TRINITY_DN7196_c0_g2_i1:104-532(+)
MEEETRISHSLRLSHLFSGEFDDKLAAALSKSEQREWNKEFHDAQTRFIQVQDDDVEQLSDAANAMMTIWKVCKHTLNHNLLFPPPHLLPLHQILLSRSPLFPFPFPFPSLSHASRISTFSLHFPFIALHILSNTLLLVLYP